MLIVTVVIMFTTKYSMYSHDIQHVYIIFFIFFFCAGVERASQSLGPLRYALNSPVKSHVAKRSLYQGDAYSSAGICKKKLYKVLV